MTDTQVRDLETLVSASPPPPDPPSPDDRGSGGGGDLPRLGVSGGFRFLWTQLTSMRTALVLLFALALAAIPGSLIPQRSVSPIRVSDFVRDNPTLGPLYDRLGLFNVYTSPWFSAIYLLLFVSLVGCIIPRVGVYARAVRARPPRTPRNLSRLPAYATGPVEDADATLQRAAATLRKARYRVDVGEDSVAAERGYLREGGNLVFHVSLLFVLLGVAVGALYGYRGTSVVITGQGFSNNLTQYDDLTAGGRFDPTDLPPFNVTVEDFRAKFETGRVQRGAARLFEVDALVTEYPGATPRRERLEVNRPLQVGGISVHLLGHGYAPEMTVTDADGEVAFSGPVVFLPQDGNFSSAGVIKVPDARPERLAFEGFFMPTADVGENGPVSVFPDAFAPAMFLNAWYGPPRTETGRPENVYSLDPTGLSQLKQADGQPVRFMLTEGQTFELPEGKGSIRFDGWTRWVKLQIGDTPGVEIILVALGFGVLGLCLSLFVRPRRVWVRVRPGEGSTLKVEVAGLDRADARGGLTEDVAELADELSSDRSRREDT